MRGRDPPHEGRGRSDRRRRRRRLAELRRARAAGSRHPFGIVPLGTANDLARTLELPVTIDEAVGVIAAGQTRWIDVGDVNGHPFFNVASLGHQRRSRDDADARKQEALRPLSIRSPPSACCRARGRSARKSSRRTRARVCAVTRSPSATASTTAADGGARERVDRRSSAASLQPRNGGGLEAARHRASFRAGRHGAWKEVRVQDATRFEIRTRRPMPVNADGEIITTTPAIVSLRPAALEVFVPPPAVV